jgi:hypothetical protein
VRGPEDPRDERDPRLEGDPRDVRDAPRGEDVREFGDVSLAEISDRTESLGTAFRNALIGGAIAAVMTIALAFGMAALLGTDDVEKRIAAQQAAGLKRTEALICILHIPPAGRTEAQTEYCLQETGIKVEDIPVPPSIRK